MIPCENCLTLPICKALRKRYKREITDGFFVTALEAKCSIIAAFTRNRYKPDFEGNPTTSLIEFFRGVSNDDPM